MPLTSGSRLGPYEILSPLGAGGMGEVFRARDTKLDRDVAIKILPASLALDPERLARFEREARVLASLNHPHIAHIYGLEHESQPFIVMELVEGETLAVRLHGRDSGLGIRDSIAIARQIADALDAAHERGIVHRDLKPANIALTADGAVKVLDFGLAKSGGSSGPGGDELTNSPTMIGPTIDGVLLGTAPYMSPEQARGKAVDKRTDIWAFGCVLFEMLTGRRAFPGETPSDAIAKILEREPDWRALPASTPPPIARLLQRCLDKDPKTRLRDIGDARGELDADRVALPVVRPRRAGRLAAAMLLAGAGVGALSAWLALRSAGPPRHPAQFAFGAPDGTQLEAAPPSPSPDGTRVAFIARTAEGQSAVWVRSIGSATPQRLAGTEGAAGLVFWSPDSQSLGFVSDRKAKRISASGGPALNIANVPSNLGATWNRDNVIVLAPVNRTVLHKVPASGGTPEPITTLNAERHENSHRWPQFLPDGRHFLFTARSDVKENNFIYIGSLDSREVKPIVAAQSPGVYVSSGALLYVREGTLMAQRFDRRALSVWGEPLVVAPNVGQNTSSSEAFFGASADGSVLVYQSGVAARSTLTWFDRTGKSLGNLGPEEAFQEVRLSPDAKTAAVVINDPESGNRDIWLVSLATATLSRFTSNPSTDWQMAWSPDSRRLAFASDRNGPSSVYVKAIDGSNEELLLRVPERGAFPRDWSSDGSTLALNVDTRAGISSLWTMRLDGERKAVPLTADDGRARDNEPALTPDGQWMAFESNESGNNEIYVVPFPKGGRRRLSTAGGSEPRWKRDGRELYYVAPGRQVMAVGISRGTDLVPSPPVRLFQACPDSGISNLLQAGERRYDVSPDGSRFLFVCAVPGSTPSTITVSLEWNNYKL